MSFDSWVHDSLKERRGQHLERHIRTEPRPARLNFSTNDYLDLARHPAVIAAACGALDAFGAGAMASRLVGGSLPIHDELERRLAELKGYPASLLFGSGFLANAGTIPALLGRDDHVFADRLVHASLLDGIALSRARLHRFQHNDPEHLDRQLARAPATGRRLIVTESVFSMDGDLAPLPALASVAQRWGADLFVDEAHATGVFGPGGAGCVSEHRLQKSVAISMFTMSKALGGYGGAVACSADLRQWFINAARSLIYTTAAPPASVGAALGALDVLRSEPDRGRLLLDRAARFRTRLHAGGFDTLGSQSPIVPILVGDNEKALTFAQRLRDRGLHAVAIRPPTVPAGTARLRLSVTLAHAESDLDEAAALLESCRL